VKDPKKSVNQLITEVSAKTGEKIEVARFSRLQVGEGS
jgi:translation elongation factor EF-Ts